LKGDEKKMGTRSTVKFYEEYKEERIPICSIYQQYDGYPSGVGLVLAEFLNSRTLVNGFGTGMDNKEFANGIGCLSAQYVAHIKKSIGSVYMTSADDSQAYNYEVIGLIADGRGAATLKVIVKDYGGKLIFDGDVEEFLEFCERGE
jgi:hypothetical protein